MRGLSNALLLSLPAVTLAAKTLQLNNKIFDYAPKIYHPLLMVSLDVPISEHAVDTLHFRINARQAKKPCDPERLIINGFPLSQDDTGFGEGSFVLLDGRVVDAQWNFACMEHVGVAWDQELTLTVRALNGKSVPDTTMSLSFRQTYPARIFSLKGAYIEAVRSSYPTKDKSGVHKEILDQISELNSLISLDREGREALISDVNFLLEGQANERGGFTQIMDADKDTDLSRKPKKERKPVASDPLSSCSTLRCVNEILTLRRWAAQVELCENSPILRPFLGCPSGPPLALVAAATVTFCLFLFVFLRLIHHRLQRRAERRARREARKEAVRAFFRNTFRAIFQRRVDATEEGEKPASRPSRDTTMEQEIANFREAASMVEELVAAEEGRRINSNRGAGRQQHRASESSPTRPPSYRTYDETLPAYDSGAEEAYSSMVSDGSRYSPVNPVVSIKETSEPDKEAHS